MPCHSGEPGLSERQIAHLSSSGRLGADEAAQLNDAGDNGRLEVIAAVRARHVTDRLADAVRLGVTSSAEVERLASRARDGDQAPEVRKIVSDLARRARALQDAS